MKPLKIKIINDLNIWHVSDKPKQVPHGYFGHSLKKRCEMISSKNGASDSTYDLPPISEEGGCLELDICTKPTTLMQSNKEHFPEFAASSHKGNMFQRAEFALNTNSPRTPCRHTTERNLSNDSPSRIPRTPHTLRSMVNKTPRRTPKTPESINTTPLSSPKSNGAYHQRSETPFTLRRKVIKRLHLLVNKDDSELDAADSDEDAYHPPSSDEATDTEEECIKSPPSQMTIPTRRRNLLNSFSRTPLRTPRRGREPKVDVDMAGSNDDYFVHNWDSGRSLTSDNTLGNLETPRLAPEPLQKILNDSLASHSRECKELLQDHSSLFPHWISLMWEGFSIFLCGVGSKKRLLSSFQSEFLSTHDHLIVNGFFPSLTIRTILATILESIVGLQSHAQGVGDQLLLVMSHYQNPDCDPLFLVIHNLDGPMLRSEKTQRVLSKLASISKIFLIASLDHINAPLIFDGPMRCDYNPLWWDATTLAPYTEETSFENSLLVQQTGAMALSSLIHVFKSLTPNAKGIFLMLARHQLSEQRHANYTGLSFDDLYQRCRENFLVNSDLTLRAQLTEFKDHKLIRIKKGYDGIENLHIPLENSTLQEFLDQHKDEES